MHTPVKDNLAADVSIALAIIAYMEELETKRKFKMPNQLFRSGTSIGTNVREAQGWESGQTSYIK